MAKSVNILEFIGILQFNQYFSYLRLTFKKKFKNDCKKVQ